jgi:uncharacterized protein YjeT (DUF2065 family)
MRYGPALAPQEPSRRAYGFSPIPAAWGRYLGGVLIIAGVVALKMAY